MTSIIIGFCLGLVAMFFLKEIVMGVFVAIGCSMRGTVSFGVAMKRAVHSLSGHPHNQSVLLDKLTSDQHPQSDSDFVYTVNISRCDDCGLTYNDCGLEYRRKP